MVTYFDFDIFNQQTKKPEVESLRSINIKFND